MRDAWIIRKGLPSCLRDLFAGKRLSSLECGVLEAFVIEELRLLDKQRERGSKSSLQTSDVLDKSESTFHISGVPPPMLTRSTLPLEPQHAA